MGAQSPLVLRTAWLAEPGVWIWEITEAGGEQIVESSWTSGWVGYDTEEAAEHAGLGRLAEMPPAGGGGSLASGGAPRREAGIAADQRAPRGRLIVVPRSRVSLYRALKRSFEDDAHIEVVLDRRFKERRTARRAGRRLDHADRRCGERRRRADIDAQLAAGRLVTIPVNAASAWPFDADARAILFLFCSEHVVGCQVCEKTYRVRWLARTGPSGFACPGCGTDVTVDGPPHAGVRLLARSRFRPDPAPCHRLIISAPRRGRRGR